MARKGSTRSTAPQPIQVLFVQGGGRGTHDSWDNKLVASLRKALGTGYSVRYPRMPQEADPAPTAWKKVIDRELARLRAGAIVVGHSIGAAILLDGLADNHVGRRLSGIFLVAVPFIGGRGWPSDDLRPTKEVAAALPGDVPLYLYLGTDDDTVPLSHIDMFEEAIPRAITRRLPGRDHQLKDDLSEVGRDIRTLRPEWS